MTPEYTGRNINDFLEDILRVAENIETKVSSINRTIFGTNTQMDVCNDPKECYPSTLITLAKIHDILGDANETLNNISSQFESTSKLKKYDGNDKTKFLVKQRY